MKAEPASKQAPRPWIYETNGWFVMHQYPGKCFLPHLRRCIVVTNNFAVLTSNETSFKAGGIGWLVAICGWARPKDTSDRLRARRAGYRISPADLIPLGGLSALIAYHSGFS
jgi:hypothetical protein